jgi:acylphosphatase
VRSRRSPISLTLLLQLQGILPLRLWGKNSLTRHWQCLITRGPSTTLSVTILDEEMVTTDKPVLARRFLVRGRVQGVGFRWFVEREAHILSIAGWVRNNADSSVEILAMGTREQLAGLRSRLREGPRAARVDDVEESEAKPISGLSTFRIEGAW